MFSTDDCGDIWRSAASTLFKSIEFVKIWSFENPSSLCNPEFVCSSQLTNQPREKKKTGLLHLVLMLFHHRPVPLMHSLQNKMIMKASAHKISWTNFKHNVIKIRKTVNIHRVSHPLAQAYIKTFYLLGCPVWCHPEPIIFPYKSYSMRSLYYLQVPPWSGLWYRSTCFAQSFACKLIRPKASRCDPCGPTPPAPRRVRVSWVRLASRRMAIFFSSLRWQITRFRCSNHNNPHAGRTITRGMLAPFCVRSDSLRAEQCTQNIS